MRIAPGPEQMPRSGIREIMDIAWTRPGVVRLEVGEPDFDTPPHIVEAAARALRDGKTRYTPGAGIPELREALATKIVAVNRFAAKSDDIVITHGAVEGIFSALACIVEAGDEVLVPDPGWPNYRMMLAVLGARPVGYELRAERGHQPDIDGLEALIGPRTRALILNSPSNPLGTILGEEALRSLVEVADRHDLWVISDECYDQVVFDDSFVSTAAAHPSERIITAYSFSKTYAMTGWRVGYLVVPDLLRDTVSKIQEPIISCVSTVAQYAAVAALSGAQDFVSESVAAYRSRRDLVAGLLRDAAVDFVVPAGAFYLWMAAGSDGAQVARQLATGHGVAVAPGPAFGPAGSQSLRVSLASSSEALVEGVTRMIRSGLIRAGDRPSTRPGPHVTTYPAGGATC